MTKVLEIRRDRSNSNFAAALSGATNPLAESGAQFKNANSRTFLRFGRLKSLLTRVSTSRNISTTQTTSSGEQAQGVSSRFGRKQVEEEATNYT